MWSVFEIKKRYWNKRVWNKWENFALGWNWKTPWPEKNTCLGGRGCGGIEVEFFNDEVLLFGQEDQTLFYFLHPSLDILQADTAAALAVPARSGHWGTFSVCWLTLAKIIQQPIRGFYIMVFEAKIRGKNNYKIWKVMNKTRSENYVFEVTWPFGEMWCSRDTLGIEGANRKRKKYVSEQTCHRHY